MDKGQPSQNQIQRMKLAGIAVLCGIAMLSLTIVLMSTGPAFGKVTIPSTIVVVEDALATANPDIVASFGKEIERGMANRSTDGNVLIKNAEASIVLFNDALAYTIMVSNQTNLTRTFTLSDPIPEHSSYVSGSATGGLVFDELNDTLTTTLVLSPSVLNVSLNSSPHGYLSLASLGVQPWSCVSEACDDDYVLFSGLDFYYNGEHYDRVAWSTNGFIQAGWNEPQAGSVNQDLPDPQAPNNVIAPLWTDLDLDGGDGVGGGSWYVAILGVGSDFYTIFEWQEAQQKGDPSTKYTFQIWIRNGSDQIWFVYDSLKTPSGFGNATVGIEDGTGSSGYTYYYNGDGNSPVTGVDLKVGATSTRLFNFGLKAEGADNDQIINQASLSNSEDSQVWIASTNTLIHGPNVDLGLDQQRTGLAGTIVEYEVEIANSGHISDTFLLDANGIWKITLNTDHTSLDAGESTTIQASVQVPVGTMMNASDTSTITATAASDPDAFDTLEMTTTATWISTHLPLVIKD
jgi:uncharacterized repeat protein (TIGR01451 family)